MPWAILGGAIITAYAADSSADTLAAGAQAGYDVQDAQYQQTREDLAPWAEAGQISLDALMDLMGLSTPESRVDLEKPKREDYETIVPGTAIQTGMGGDAGTSETVTFDQAGYDAAMDAYNAAVAGAQATPEGYGSLMEPFDLDKFEESPGYQFVLDQGMEAINKAAAANSGTTYAPQTLRDLGEYAQGTASLEYDAAYNRYNTDQTNAYNRLAGISDSGLTAAGQLGTLGTYTAGQQSDLLTDAASAEAAGTVGVANAVTEGIGSAYDKYLQDSILSSQTPTYGGSRIA